MTWAPGHFDRGHLGLKSAIAVVEKTPMLVNLLNRDLDCTACEDVVRWYGASIDTFVQ
jgi:hypothetical protein